MVAWDSNEAASLAVALQQVITATIDREVAAHKPEANPNNITFDDYLGLNHALFEWADSYDAKDWARLSRCIAPTLRVSSLFQRTVKRADGHRSTTAPSSARCGKPCRPPTLSPWRRTRPCSATRC
jgi:hypothetical protein